jgi:hypothetical protein
LAPAMNRAYRLPYYLYGLKRIGSLSGRRYLVGQRTVEGRRASSHTIGIARSGRADRRQDRIQRCWVGDRDSAKPIRCVATAFALAVPFQRTGVPSC